MPAPKKRSITAEDLYNLQMLSDVRISPDGGHVAYRLQRVDKKTEKKYGNLWIVPTGGGEPRQFTFGDQSDSSPRWSPDGRTVYMKTFDARGQAALWALGVDGGAPRLLVRFDEPLRPTRRPEFAADRSLGGE